jgi:hypothetical protein
MNPVCKNSPEFVLFMEDNPFVFLLLDPLDPDKSQYHRELRPLQEPQNQDDIFVTRIRQIYEECLKQTNKVPVVSFKIHTITVNINNITNINTITNTTTTEPVPPDATDEPEKPQTKRKRKQKA